MALRQLGWREIRKRPGRAALTLASVVIGVAAMVAVSLTTKSTRTAFDDVYASMAGRADLEVAAPISTMIDESLLGVIDQTPGVAAAAPMIQRPTKMYREWQDNRHHSLGHRPRARQGRTRFSAGGGRVAHRRPRHPHERRLRPQPRHQSRRSSQSAHPLRQQARPGHRALQVAHGGHHRPDPPTCWFCSARPRRGTKARASSI